MKNILVQLYRDEAGFIVSAELILIATITVLSTIVGLSEVSVAINSELSDCANAFGAVNQSYRYDNGGYDDYGNDNSRNRRGGRGRRGGSDIYGR